jgi:hypothetical protein
MNWTAPLEKNAITGTPEKRHRDAADIVRQSSNFQQELD